MNISKYQQHSIGNAICSVFWIIRYTRLHMVILLRGILRYGRYFLYTDVYILYNIGYKNV